MTNNYTPPPGYARVSDLLRQFMDDLTHPYYLRRGTWIGDCCDILAMGSELDEETKLYGVTHGRTPTGTDERWLSYVDRYRELIASAEWRRDFGKCLAIQEESVNEVERVIGHSDQRWQTSPHREAIIDIKTGTVRKCVALQLAFYDLGTPINKRRRRFSIHLTAEKAVLTEWKDSRDYDAARLAARWWHRSQDYR